MDGGLGLGLHGSEDSCRHLATQRPVAEAVIQFWTEELSPKDWYAGGDKLDNLCRDRFGALLEKLHKGALDCWRVEPRPTFAYIILADQLSRNIFRGDPRAFQTDAKARSATKQAIAAGWDLLVEPPARQFFYLPLEHSESMEDQDRAVRLIRSRLPDGGGDTLLHARVHREIIRRFGRFPSRNETLGRRSTAAEIAFLEGPGYGGLLNEMKAPA